MNLKLIAAGVLALVTVGASAQNINGAGATFTYPIHSKWFSEYSQLHPNVKINYQSIGSGGGIRQVSEGTVDFGASDVTMTDAQITAAKVKVMAIPAVLGAVVPVYNVPGVNKELNFSGDVIADIYLGKISQLERCPHRERQSRRQSAEQSDPACLSLGWKRNVVHLHRLSRPRSRQPGTLVREGAPRSIGPPGIGQKGNEGIAGMVRQSPNTFGYVELIYAVQNKMSYGLVKNAAGKYREGKH